MENEENIVLKVKKPRKAFTKDTKESKLLAEMQEKMKALELELELKEEKLAKATQAVPKEKILPARDTEWRDFKPQIATENDNYDPKIGFQKYGSSKWKKWESGPDQGLYRQLYINIALLANPNTKGF